MSNSLAARVIITALLSPAEEGAQQSRSRPRGLSRSDLQQLAQGGEDLVQDLQFSDED